MGADGLGSYIEQTYCFCIPVANFTVEHQLPAIHNIISKLARNFAERLKIAERERRRNLGAMKIGP
jgi:hypothetical protein